MNASYKVSMTEKSNDIINHTIPDRATVTIVNGRYTIHHGRRSNPVILNSNNEEIPETLINTLQDNGYNTIEVFGSDRYIGRYNIDRRR